MKQIIRILSGQSSENEIMKITNYSDFDGPSLEKLIYRLLPIIPKCLIPQQGFPDFHITNSLFHSYGIMYQKYKPTGENSDEEFYEFCQKQNVWAFSCLDEDANGDVYLGLKYRITHNKEYQQSIEHVIFHEIGHHFYYHKGFDIKSMVDFTHEKLADIYANACMLSYYQQGGCNINGYYAPMKDRTLSVLSAYSNAHIPGNKLLKTGKKIYDEWGVL